MTVVDVHAHYVPRGWPALDELCGGEGWPWLRIESEREAVIMLRESFVAAQASFLYVAVLLADDTTPALTRRCSLSCPPRLPRCSRRRLPRRPPQRAQIPSGSSA